MHISVNKTTKIVVMYILWFALSGMIFFLLITGRTSLLTAIARYSTRGFSQSMSARLFDKIYMIVAAIAALAVIIVMERYMANSRGWKGLLLRFARALGIMLLALSVITAITQAYLRDIFTSFMSTAFLLGPAVLGIALIVISSLIKINDKSLRISGPILPSAE